MTQTSERVVFDCNVHFQALTSPQGPAAKLLVLAASGDIQLFVSEYTLNEIADVAARPRIVAKYRLNSQIAEKFLQELRRIATVIDVVPHVFDLPRDPDDAHYVDLAVAAHARLIVSRDKDLLSLRDSSTEEGRDFLAQFPTLSILTPPEALALIESDRSP
jgi:putative PIN family toxin of toxin-antitoxin system